MEPASAHGPSPFNPTDHGTDVARAFDKWLTRFEIYCDHILQEPEQDNPTASALYAKNKKKKLLWFIGDAGMDDIDSVHPNARGDPAVTFDVIVQSLRRRYQPKASRWQAIAKYRALQQDLDEPISKFAERCRRQAELCGFVRDDFNEQNPVKLATKIQLILGTCNQTLRDAAIQKNWSLQEVVDNGTLFEDSASASNVLNSASVMSNQSEVLKISGLYSRRRQRQTMTIPSNNSTCQNCGSTPWHPHNQCPAKGIACSTCNRTGHFGIVCRSRSRQGEGKPTAPERSYKANNRTSKQRMKPGNTKSTSTASASIVGEESDQTSDEEAHFLQVFMTKAISQPITASPQVQITVDGKKLIAVADSGAQINVIPKRLCPQSLVRSLKPTKIRIKPYGATSSPILPIGMGIADVSWDGHTLATKWYVIEDSTSQPLTPLISCETCVSLGLLTRLLTNVND